MEKKGLAFFDNLPLELEQHITDYINIKSFASFYMTSKNRLRNALPRLIKLQKNLEVLPNFSLATGFQTSFYYYANKLFCSGNNKYGQLGSRYKRGTLCNFKLVKAFPVRIQRVIAGGNHTFVLTEQGLFACGKDYYFEMGLSEKFKKINNQLGKILQIVTGGGHTLILTDKGLFGVGDNYHGQLGLGGHYKWGKITLIDHLYAQENRFLPLFFCIEKLKEFDNATENAKCSDHCVPRP